MKYRDIDLHNGTVYIAPVKEGLMEIPISNADAAVNKLADYIEKQEADLRKLVERMRNVAGYTERVVNAGDAVDYWADELEAVLNKGGE